MIIRNTMLFGIQHWTMQMYIYIDIMFNSLNSVSLYSINIMCRNFQCRHSLHGVPFMDDTEIHSIRAHIFLLLYDDNFLIKWIFLSLHSVFYGRQPAWKRNAAKENSHCVWHRTAFIIEHIQTKFKCSIYLGLVRELLLILFMSAYLIYTRRFATLPIWKWKYKSQANLNTILS